MDLAKAVSLMLTNTGSSANYQGWDLIKNPGIYHFGIPTFTFLNAFSKSYGEKALQLCRDVFITDGPKRSFESEENLMMASYCGGMSIAYSQVGICHELSYGLSSVLGIHHGVGNCIAFNALDEYYPEGVDEFRKMMDINQIELPKNVVAEIPTESLERMIDVSLVLGSLWENALGKNWKAVMTREKIKALYQRM